MFSYTNYGKTTEITVLGISLLKRAGQQQADLATAVRIWSGSSISQVFH